MASTEADEVVVAYRTSDSLDAHALAGQLAEEGVNARVVGDFLSGGYGGITGLLTQVEVWIPSVQQKQAAPLIARWRGDDVQSAQDSRPRFRFSLMTALAALTLVAIYAGMRPIAMSEVKTLAFAAGINLAFWVGFVYFALKRRRLARMAPRPKPPSTPLD